MALSIPSSSSRKPNSSSGSPVKALWLLFTLFVVYGATIPFHFTTDRDILAVHWQQLSANPLLSPEKRRVSIPDDAQNILLFVPFGVLGVLAKRTARPTLARILFVTGLGAALSASVETLQFFTRDRIPSSADILNNTAGALVGAIAAYRLGAICNRILQRFKRIGLVDRQTFFPLIVATAVVCLAAWEPFDVTLDVSSQVLKIRSFLRDPWQFNGLKDEGVALLHSGLFAAALGLWLNQRGSRRAVASSIALGVPFVVALEVSQIAIATRMPGLEDALVRAAGVIAGAGLLSVWQKTGGRSWWLILLLVATAAGAALQMLSPFEMTDQPRSVQWVPFMNYYEVTTSVTLSHALELMLIYFPLGFCFTMASTRSARSVTVGVIVIALAIAVPIEYFQGWIVGRYPDVTDPCLSALGGWVGVWTARRGAAIFDERVTRLDLAPSRISSGAISVNS
jgi:VanZ family protein